MSTGELVSIDPLDLKFPFELNKQINSSLQLTNKTDQHVGFKVKTTNPKKYCVRPNTGVVSPKSTCEIIVTMQAQKEAPPDMQCKDKFLLQSVTVGSGATTKDITPELFSKDSGNTVEECKLRVVYVPATQSTSIVAQGAEPVLPSNGPSGAEVSRAYVDSNDKSSSEVRALISKLTDEKNAAIEQSKRIQQELELLRRRSNKSQGGGASLILVIVVGLIGLILGYILKK
ncbi:putative major sperm protein (MSP) [Helianthus annuus]|uniref:Major sperm protein (MSP) n=1 Tax=Helianthus annuus TaxID=4232 RepID=A0A251SX35_HELAN|nr:vesicle-associated protein 1-1 [Helianthus annuus]KAF5774923.1 putative major sperm protein (MSP) [Helianthus annuus]KAJ0478159.1 putative major sperm protein (MSP) [Helianthus annuus]KAJ0482860.1 putative major sperm protein (MSP) [Helianthus annuus]KAJ0499048.1 putative major sperm protein (MSP) [Helianthus annuus]KAJ0665062.1 putative major sperm protein (MSP) [Helianthus annuus]